MFFNLKTLLSANCKSTKSLPLTKRIIMLMPIFFCPTKTKKENEKSGSIVETILPSSMEKLFPVREHVGGWK